MIFGASIPWFPIQTVSLADPQRHNAFCLLGRGMNGVADAIISDLFSVLAGCTLASRIKHKSVTLMQGHHEISSRLPIFWGGTKKSLHFGDWLIDCLID